MIGLFDFPKSIGRKLFDKEPDTEANREVIKDADLIFPGQKVRIFLDQD